jgi:hypothetical protein
MVKRAIYHFLLDVVSMVESLCDKLALLLGTVQECSFFILVPHFTECSPGAKLPAFCGMSTKRFNLIFSEEIIQYSRTFALQVQMSWNQSPSCTPPHPELSKDAKNTI